MLPTKSSENQTMSFREIAWTRTFRQTDRLKHNITNDNFNVIHKVPPSHLTLKKFENAICGQD